jgi:hypothetical protein
MNAVVLSGPAEPRRRWPWMLGLTLLVMLALSLLAAVALAGYVGGGHEGFQLIIDDEHIQLLPHGFEAGIGTVFGLMLALLVVVLGVVLVVPLTLALVAVAVVCVLGLVALSVGGALALAAAAVVLALLLVTSPLWLLALLLWWLLRSRPVAAS